MITFNIQVRYVSDSVTVELEQAFTSITENTDVSLIKLLH